jgi:hypothetical protein
VAARVLGVALESRHRRRHHAVAHEGTLAGEHLVEHGAQRVEIRARADLLAAHLLGRHVGRRPHHLRPDRDLDVGRHSASETEVGEDHAAALVEQHVRGLDVAVHDPDVVRRGEPLRDLAADVGGLADREPPLPRDQAEQAVALDQLHGEVEETLGGAEIEDARGVSVRHAARQAHFAPEALHGVAGSAGEDLERDAVADLLVVGGPDRAGRAAPEQAVDAVALGEELAALELVAHGLGGCPPAPAIGLGHHPPTISLGALRGSPRLRPFRGGTTCPIRTSSSNSSDAAAPRC